MALIGLKYREVGHEAQAFLPCFSDRGKFWRPSKYGIISRRIGVVRAEEDSNF